MNRVLGHPGGPAIAVAHLAKRFDAVVAVNDISFDAACSCKKGNDT